MTSGSTVRQRLERGLREALRARDRLALPVLRSALAALDNASAVPAGPPPAAGGPHIAGAAVGVGAAEAPRRVLTDGQAAEIVRAEIAERREAARGYERSGHTGRAGQLHREAAVLEAVLSASPGPSAGPS